MNAKMFIIATGVMAILAGCMPSVYPLYTDKDIVLDPSLVGTWINQEDDEKWTFARGDGQSYDMAISGEDSTVMFQTHLVELGGHRFIDVCPRPPDWEDSPYRDLMLPLHWLGSISIDGDTLIISLMDPNDMSKLAKSGVKTPSYVDVDNLRVLTASTEELQKFIIDNLDKKVFTVPGRMFRQK
jgi:hypothetical protein